VTGDVLSQVVTEQAATLTESEGVTLVDGRVVASHQQSSFTQDLPAPLDEDDDLPPPPAVNQLDDDFLPPPPSPAAAAITAGGLEDDDLPPPESPRSSYAALVTPSGFVSPTETSRRNFTKRRVI
jgi:hypothetical protein